MNDALKCRRYFISGRVQGVFYRASAQRYATELALAGWVRNRRDGRVEVLAIGTEAQHRALKNWLEIGPTYAKVSNIEVIDETFEPPVTAFEVRPTL